MPKAVFVSKIGSRTSWGVVIAALVVALGQISPALCAPSAEKVPYLPSRFPGVQVRQVSAAPARTAATGGAAWLGKRRGTIVKRGVVSPLRAVRSASPPRTGRGITPAGGKWVAMPSERVPLAVARGGKSGKVVVDCLVPSVASVALSKKPVR